MKISEIISDNCDLLGDVREAEEKQQHCEDEYIKVPKKALKYRTAGMVAYNAEWLKNHFDIERAVICGVQEHYEDAISRQAVLKIIDGWYEQNRDTDNIEDLIVLITYMDSVNPQKPICPSAGIDCEDCPAYEDTISRQAAIDAIYARYIGGKEAVDKAPANDQYAEGIDEAVCAVEDLPPVTPQPKSECEHDHEILKAYSDGASAVLDKVRAEIMNLQTYKMFEGEDAVYVERENVLQIIDEFTAEGSEKE